MSQQFPPDSGQPQPPYSPSYQQSQPPYPQQVYGDQRNQMPMPKPSRKRRRWPWIVGGILVLVIVIIIIASAASSGGTPTANSSSSNTVSNTPASSQPTSAPKPTQPAHTPVWTTIQTFTGNGTKNTGTFSVPGDWKIVWSCQGFTDGTGLDGSLSVTITGTDNVPVDFLSETCKAGGTSKGVSEEHQAGNVYLAIDGTGAWKVQVQVLK